MTFKDAFIEGLSPSVGPVADPVTGYTTTAADLHDRDRRAREVAESLPPRQLRIVRLAYESLLADVLQSLTGHDCRVSVKTLPRDIATGAKSVKQAEDEVFLLLGAD